jgi:deoxyribodipyrimidine photo-lyase
MRRPVIMWFRRDLRLADHPALQHASALGPVVPLFVVDPMFEGSGAPRRAYMCDALAALDRSIGGALVYRHGHPAQVLPDLVAELGAAAVVVTRDHGPYGRRRDEAVAGAVRAAGADFVGVGSSYAVQPGSVTKADGTPYQVFTPFSKAWRAHGWAAPIPQPDVDWIGTPGVACDGPPTRPDVATDFGEASERWAWDRWTDVLPALQQYADVRNDPAIDGTSRLSAALRWGLVHPRQLLHDLGPERGHEVFASELAWREFYADVLFRRPDTAWSNLNPKMDAMPVDVDDAARRRFRQWADGATGYPIVDAGMRQLLATGWMHNRVRMLVASFLVKDLHLPWQWGAHHFMQHLVDGDLASNSHGWQWTAGTGTDAAPYFRIFNPTTQGLRFDPQGDYVRRWIPELSGIAGGSVHTPAPLTAPDYPAPIVDHRVERDDSLARYRSAMAGSR